MAGSNLEKRIATLEAKANSRGARWIVIEVDGDLPDEEAAVETLLEPLCVGRHDTVVAIKKFAVTKGLPRVASITPL
jgi:hypothetical protein